VDKVTSWTIGTEADTVIGATQICLVFWMPGNCAQFLIAVGKLTFVSVLACAVLLIRAAHLSFVAVGILNGGLGLAGAGGHGGSGR